MKKQSSNHLIHTTAAILACALFLAGSPSCRTVSYKDVSGKQKMLHCQNRNTSNEDSKEEPQSGDEKDTSTFME